MVNPKFVAAAGVIALASMTLPSAWAETDATRMENEKKPSAYKVDSSGATHSGAAHSGTAHSGKNAEEVIENENDAAAHEPDNTGKNARDVNEGRKTADSQKLGGDDLQVLAQIRKNVVANDTLSTNAKNVKIMVESGVVTLRGPVKSAEEKMWIEQEVNRTAQGYKIVNQLEIAPG